MSENDWSNRARGKAKKEAVRNEKKRIKAQTPERRKEERKILRDQTQLELNLKA